MRKATLAKVKDDLSRYLILAEKDEVIITKHGKPAGVLIGLKDEDEWFEYKLIHDPKFLNRATKAREDIVKGKGILLS